MHDVAGSKALYLAVEGMGRRYVLKRLVGWYLRVACGIGHDLRGLPTSGVSEGAEVGHACCARLTHSTACIAAHVPSSRQPVDPLVERISWRHVLEYLWVWDFGEPCRIADDLGKLSPCDKVVGAESAICIA